VQGARQFQPLLITLSVGFLCSFTARLPGRPVSSYLRLLATRANNHRGWAPLRRYARLARDKDSRGFAYFVLGYHEYKANQVELAQADFDLAMRSNCRLRDLAEYYDALADQQLNKNAEGAQILQNLLNRRLDAGFRSRATTLQANLLTQAGQVSRAIQVLNGTPGSLRDPSSLLALAKAYQAEADDRQAASVYKTVYYDFPLTGFADAAGAALNGLRVSLGQSYSVASDRRESDRAAKIFQASQYGRALNAYTLLLQREPQSSMADEWIVDRARCLLNLGHYDLAAETLLDPMKGNQTADAKRLGVLVHIYERADDEPSMLNSLSELYRLYPRSWSYASALFFAGAYFSRHGFWETAAPYYQRLVQGFPNARWAPQADWWATWYKVLGGQNEEAASGLQAYLQAYPDSYHVPAALYWLARIKAELGLTKQSEQLYGALADRFPHSFYGLKARGILGGHFDENRSLAPVEAPPSTILADLRVTLRPLSPPALNLREPMAIKSALEPVAILGQLGLSDAADQVLGDAIQAFPRNPDFFFALARLRAQEEQTASALFAARSAVPNYEDYSFNELPRQEWKLLYPMAYWRLVRAYSRLDGLNPYLVMGLIRQESAFDPRATSSADARGLMQIRPGTAAFGIRSRWRRRRVAQLLYNPRYNVRVSSRYLRNLFRMFQGHTEEAIAAYNAGDVWVKNWIANGKFRSSDEFVESIPFGDTRAYVESVIRDAAIYRSILSGTARFTPERLQEN
jgi:soluble lytic murein transglycosylase